MEIIIVTGMSGAGKTQAINVLEDIGYYCVDNVPATLIAEFVGLIAQLKRIEKICLVSDIRAGEYFGDFIRCLNVLKDKGYNYKILYLDAADNIISNRYKESRRKHPLAQQNGISTAEAISDERKIMHPINEMADYHIDTSIISTAQLKSVIIDMFNRGESAMSIRCMSFGFKTGTPPEADLILDVRCLPNPFYIEGLKEKNGLDEPVKEYVMGCDETAGLLERFYALIDYLLPLYSKEGKSQLVIGIGCTGGKHRSVVVCEQLNKHILNLGYNSIAHHRDAGR